MTPSTVHEYVTPLLGMTVEEQLISPEVGELQLMAT